MNDLLPFLYDFIFPVIFILNIGFALTVVFIERKNPTATIAWLMALLFAPVLGFLLYLFIGQSFYRDRMFGVKKEDDEALTRVINSQKKDIFTRKVPESKPIPDAYRRMMLMLMESNKAPVTTGNQARDIR